VTIFRSTVDIDRPPEVVFDVYARVEEWPGWTASIRQVRRLDPGPLAVGSRTEVRQPRLPVAVWTVTELVPGEVFSWESSAPGLRSVGRHRVHPRPGGCTAVAEIEHSGPLAPLLVLLTRRLTARYLRLECEGLRRRCEEEA
jgi:uncharacterized membrane protein